MASRRDDADPRRADRVVEFRMNPEEPGSDSYALSALVFGLISILLKVKLFAWVTLLCVLGSLANTKHSQADKKGILALCALTALAFLGAHTERTVLFPAIVRKLRSL